MSFLAINPVLRKAIEAGESPEKNPGALGSNIMSRCEISGKRPMVKNLVSHSNRKTKAKSNPNVQSKRLFSKYLDQFIRLQVATKAIKDMEHMGGFDYFILNQEDSKLSARALEVKNRIIRKISSKPAKKQ